MLTFASKFFGNMENDTLVEQVAENIQDTTAVNSMVEGVKKLATTPVSDWLPDLVKEYLVPFGIKLVAAIVVLLLGRWVIKLIKKGLTKVLLRGNTDPSLNSFVMSLVSVLLTFFLILAIVGILGINTSSLVALLASAGLAIGMALSGTLQNFAGGVMIMLFKPFKVGDFIDAQGYAGVVQDLSIVSTKILTVDNRLIVIPNGALSNGNIANVTGKELRRVDIDVNVAYGNDAEKVKNALIELAKANPLYLDASTKGADNPFAALVELNECTVHFVVRAWVKAADYWTARFQLQEAIYKELPEKYGVTFAFPQMDVHVRNA
jgi:small conductance mechanosensitive channel